MYLPPITATVVRYEYFRNDTTTGGFFPAPSDSTTAAGTSMPVADLPASNNSALNFMHRPYLALPREGANRERAHPRHLDRYGKQFPVADVNLVEALRCSS